MPTPQIAVATASQAYTDIPCGLIAVRAMPTAESVKPK